MSGRELTDKDYIRNIVQSEIRHSTPSIGEVTSVYEPGSDGPEGNYEVDVDVLGSGYPTSVEGSGDPEFSPQTHDAVPVTVPMSGVTTGLQVGSMVLIQYLNANSEAPLVTDVIYTEDNQAPMTNEGEFRIRLGDGAVIEVVQGEDGGQELNIGHQPEDHQGIETGLSVSLDDGSFSLLDGSEKGIVFDGDGNGVFDWESIAQPWGAAGPVSWDEAFGSGEGVTRRNLSITVEDANGEPVEDATVTVEQSTGNNSDDGSTDDGSTDDGTTDDGSTSS